MNSSLFLSLLLSILTLPLTAYSGDDDPIQIQNQLDPTAPSLEIGAGAELAGSRVFVSVDLEHRGRVLDPIRYVRVSFDAGIQKTTEGGNIFRYAHVDITPVTWNFEDKFVSLGLLPVSIDAERELELESAYKVRAVEASANFGSLGFETGFFVHLAAQIAGYQLIRFTGDHDRASAFDYGSLQGDAGYTWNFKKGETLRWQIIDVDTSLSTKLFETDLKSQVTFYLDQLIRGALAFGWKDVSGVGPSFSDRKASGFYVKLGLGILISGR